jgi:hypothetical protein
MPNFNRPAAIAPTKIPSATAVNKIPISHIRSVLRVAVFRAVPRHSGLKYYKCLFKVLSKA